MTTTLSSKALNQLSVAVADNTTHDEIRKILDGTNVSHRPVITVTDATKTLTAAQSGSLVVLDLAAGIVITLPESNADNAGWYCDFVVKTTFTGTFSIVSSRAADLWYGSANVESPTAATGKYFIPAVGSSDDRLVADSDAKGRVAGGYIRVELGGANVVVVSGALAGTGSPATPFT